MSELQIDHALLSSALSTAFRGRLCQAVLSRRTVLTFEKNQTLYDVGDENRAIFFIRSGFVKVGTITEDGHELIYDVRKKGDIVGELCASGGSRQDRAIALECTEVAVVPFDEILEIAQKDKHLLRQLLQAFSSSLSDAYEQMNSLAFNDIVHRLVRVLVKLAGELGRSSGNRIEIPTYLTQEEIAQMVAVRRERVSTAMNFLRRRGMLTYSHHGHLIVDLKALQKHAG